MNLLFSAKRSASSGANGELESLLGPGQFASKSATAKYAETLERSRKMTEKLTALATAATLITFLLALIVVIKKSL